MKTYSTNWRLIYHNTRVFRIFSVLTSCSYLNAAPLLTTLDTKQDISYKEKNTVIRACCSLTTVTDLKQASLNKSEVKGIGKIKKKKSSDSNFRRCRQIEYTHW